MSYIEKLEFMYSAMSERKEISAHIFNDVFTEFQDKFYSEKPYKNAILNFKKVMRDAAFAKGHDVAVLTLSKLEKISSPIHGINNLWSIVYSTSSQSTKSESSSE